MSHELTVNDRAVYAINAPWHYSETGTDGRAILNDRTFTLDEALSQSSIGDHRTVARELYFADGTPAKREAHVGPRGELYSVTSLGAPMVQYADLFSAARDLFERYGVEIHVAGTLSSGGKAWIGGKLPDEFVVSHSDGRRESHYPWLTLQAAFDQSIALQAYLAQWRIECNNMLQAAQGDADRTGQRVRARGTTDSYLNRWGTALERLGDSIAEERLMRSTVQKLATSPFNAGDFDRFAAELLLTAETRAKQEQAAMEALFGEVETRREAIRTLNAALVDPDAAHGRMLCLEMGVGPDAPISRRSANLFAKRHTTLAELFVKGKGNKGADRYDALNAVTEWVDHHGVRDHRGEKVLASEKRFVSALGGEGANLKAKAFELLSV